MEFKVNEVPGKEISITEKDEAALTYQYCVSESHSYIHPLYAPNGHVITDVNSETYPRGLCFTLGKVCNKNGKQLQLQRNASTLNWEFLELDSNENSIKFVSNTTYETTDIELVESCHVIVHPIKDNVRILDMSIVLQTDNNHIQFMESFGLSYFAADMEHRKTANSEGRIGEAEVNQELSDWVTLCGITENTPVGVAIIPHPSNGKTNFHAKDAYQGYLLAQTQQPTIDTHGTLTLDYCLIIYVGDIFTIDISDYYEKYAQQELTR